MEKSPWMILCVSLIWLASVAVGDRPFLRQVTKSKFTDHLIRELPGAPPYSFDMHSGYITVDQAHGRALFYWFVEADVEDPTTAPLTLWLNGGPGCSSVGGGALSELGPFYPDKDGKTLFKNPYSWNKVSNLIFLESPAGVGFSYSNTTADYTTGDEKTALDSYEFLVQFLKLYPEFAKVPFYIAGESYAGHYVPQLAASILALDKDSVFNFKGIAIGNAWTDSQIDNFGAIFYWWTHALISDTSFYGMSKTCNFSEHDLGSTVSGFDKTYTDRLQQDDDACEKYVDLAGKEMCNFSGTGPLKALHQARVKYSPAELTCEDYINLATTEMGNINIYEIYVDVCLSASAEAEVRHFAKQLNRNKPAALGALPLKANLASYDPCLDNEVETYLNRPAVQAALHANTTGLPYIWTDCSRVVDYSHKDLLSSVIPVYTDVLLKSKLRILIYSGDTDAIVPVTGSRAWINTLELNKLQDWRPYYVNKQVGGYVTSYDRLTFATVRGAGHMVPYTQPGRALYLFGNFISDTAL